MRSMQWILGGAKGQDEGEEKSTHEKVERAKEPR